MYTGFVPFFRKKFSELFQDPDWFFKGSKIHINPYHSQDLNVNFPYCLLYTWYFLVEFKRFPELSRTSGLFLGFPVLENTRMQFHDFPGFPGPVRTLCTAAKWGRVVSPGGTAILKGWGFLSELFKVTANRYQDLDLWVWLEGFPPLRGTKILFCGCGLRVFHPSEVPRSCLVMMTRFFFLLRRKQFESNTLTDTDLFWLNTLKSNAKAPTVRAF